MPVTHSALIATRSYSEDNGSVLNDIDSGVRNYPLARNIVHHLATRNRSRKIFVHNITLEKLYLAVCPM